MTEVNNNPHIRITEPKHPSTRDTKTPSVTGNIGNVHSYALGKMTASSDAYQANSLNKTKQVSIIQDKLFLGYLFNKSSGQTIIGPQKNAFDEAYRTAKQGNAGLTEAAFFDSSCQNNLPALRQRAEEQLIQSITAATP